MAAVLNNKPSLREQGHRDVQGGVQEKTFEVTDLKEPETAVIIVDNKAIKAIGNGSVWYDPCPPRPPPQKKASQKDPWILWYNLALLCVAGAATFHPELTAGTCCAVTIGASEYEIFSPSYKNWS